MKHILIDARLYGPTHTGIGRYIQNILLEIQNLPNFSNYKWTLLAYPELIDTMRRDLGTKYNFYVTNIRHYSFQEQIFLPFLLYQLRPDLVHVPHFNKPLFYFGKTVVTVHDLIKHFSKGKETTTRFQIFYWPKYWAYRLLTFLVIKTNFLIVPTNFWRTYIINHFDINPDKIITTYEATTFKINPKFKPQNITTKPYLLYTGNLYPHKNINVVLEALQKIPTLSLKIISKPNKFSDRCLLQVSKLNLNSRVEFLGFVSDHDFVKLYQHALAFVFPSLMEGFGLPGLEAQSLGCPVISSDSSCLREVYQDSVLYFNPYKSQELLERIIELQNSPSLRLSLIKKGYLQVKLYSWQKTAIQTLTYYEKILQN